MNLATLYKNEFDRFGEHVSLIYEDREFTNVEMRQLAYANENSRF
jgi:hypothetical protein